MSTAATSLPRQHFELYLQAAVAALRQALPSDRHLPWLAEYDSERHKSVDVETIERRAASHLPLRALRTTAGLDDDDLALLFTVGVAEEDPRFGELFEVLQGSGYSQPTLGLVKALSPGRDVRLSLRRLRALGLIDVVNPEQTRLAWSLAVVPAVWDALRGDIDPELGPCARLRPIDQQPDLDSLILDAEFAAIVARAPAALAAEQAPYLIVRGRQASGRRTLVSAMARSLGLGTLELAPPPVGNWRSAGALATLLRAMPLTVLELGPSETVDLPPLLGFKGPTGVALGMHGGLASTVRGTLTFTLELPAPIERDRHWRAALGEPPPPGLVTRYRMTGGNIRRAAALARSQATLSGRSFLIAEDVRLATRALHGQLLDSVAERLPAAEDWGQLALRTETRRELELLERRCLERERLADSGGPALRGQLGAGVRALLTGPSGTGKTLAARVLAGRLALDAYRLNLASVVNKYIGETEKNLERALASAEAANAVLLFDEGDALFTQRTAVNTANDRYANLETNYLLQRLESFEGILVVATNAGDRIDAAFRRRMDVIIDFRPPEPLERLQILELHMRPDHAVSSETLETIAVRCDLTGGQLRNAVLHAELLALQAKRRVGDLELDEAIRREYRKIGAVCPLPPAVGEPLSA
jgi:hypothetical protein